MFTTNNTPVDPRERLLTVGNDLLNVVYEIEKITPSMDRFQAAKDDKDLLTELMKEDGAVEVLIKSLELSSKRTSLVREYTTLRQTIEALTGGDSR